MAMSPEPVDGVGLSTLSHRRTAASGNALAVASMLTWAAGFPAAEILLQSWPPLTLIVARTTLAILALVPVWLWFDGPNRILNARWKHALFVGGNGFGLGTYLLLMAQKLTDPVTVTLIVSCAPIIGTLLELRAGTRQLRWQFGLGVLASIIGGLIATSALAPAQLGLGALLAIVSTGLFCWASMATARDFPDLSQAGRTTITLTGGLAVSAPILAITALFGLDVMPTRAVDGQQIGMLLIFAIVATAISQLLFVSSVHRLGVAIATFHMNVAPFYVMIIMVVLGESWNWTQAAGAGIVGLGVILSQARGNPFARRIS